MFFDGHSEYEDSFSKFSRLMSMGLNTNCMNKIFIIQFEQSENWTIEYL